MACRPARSRIFQFSSFAHLPPGSAPYNGKCVESILFDTTWGFARLPKSNGRKVVGGEKRGPACHRSPSAEPRTEETVKTCAVLTPRLEPSLDPVMALVQEPANSNFGNYVEAFSFRTGEKTWVQSGSLRHRRSYKTISFLCGCANFRPGSPAPGNS